MTADQALIPLRRIFAPYIGQAIILGGVTVLMIYTFFKSSDTSWLWVATVPWFLFGIFVVCFGLKYEVLFDQECLVMRASGGPERRIQFDEIRMVTCETSSISDVAAQSRPFFRIAVYPKRHPKQFVDISLRHFKREDIQELLTTLREHRPDLDIPTVFVDALGRVRCRKSPSRKSNEEKHYL